MPVCPGLQGTCALELSHAARAFFAHAHALLCLCVRKVRVRLRFCTLRVRFSNTACVFQYSNVQTYASARRTAHARLHRCMPRAWRFLVHVHACLLARVDCFIYVVHFFARACACVSCAQDAGLTVCMLCVFFSFSHACLYVLVHRVCGCSRGCMLSASRNMCVIALACVHVAGC
jgi:hypothetical protein